LTEVQSDSSGGRMCMHMCMLLSAFDSISWLLLT